MGEAESARFEHHGDMHTTGCARMRWSKRAITFEVCSTSFKRGVCTCSESPYSMSPIPGAPPATNQLAAPLTILGWSQLLLTCTLI